MRVVVLVCLVGTVLALNAGAAGQIVFDVASIKENREPGGPGGLRRAPDGSLRTERFRAQFLITIAYRLQPFQLVGAPAWANNTYYDINARPAAGSSTSRDQMSDMLQTLLVERFKLAFHREVRPVDGYALVQLKRGTLGPDLTDTYLKYRDRALTLLLRHPCTTRQPELRSGRYLEPEEAFVLKAYLREVAVAASPFASYLITEAKRGQP